MAETFKPFPQLDDILKADDHPIIGLYPVTTLPIYDSKYVGSVYYTVLTMYGLQLLHWMKKENALDGVWWRDLGMKNRQVLFFSDGSTSHVFREWTRIAPKPPERLFMDRDAFMREVSETGEISLRGSLTFDLTSDTTTFLDELSCDVWMWLIDNAQGRYWRWHKKFFFEDGRDLVHFKMRWHDALPKNS